VGQDHTAAIDVAVVDDSPAVCESIAAIFEVKGFQVHTYGSGEAFLARADEIKPDCVLLDLHLPDGSGLDVLEAIGGSRYPAPVIMFSRQGGIPMAVAAIKAGAHNFIEKPFDADAVILDVRQAVHQYRERNRSPALPPIGRSFPGADALTTREMDVLQKVAEGASNKEVGRMLGISPRTVEVHRAHILEKLGARNTSQMMRIVLCGDPPRLRG
jgi:two-component system, LuxR family, response regulator FixJ